MITGITHIAINTADMAKSVEFYCGVLGFKEAFELKDKDGNPWIKYIKAGGNQFIELFYNGTGFVKGSVSHICFAVDDINVTAETLKKSGAPLTSGPSQGKDGNKQCWSRDPDGIPIEFMQLSPDSLQAEAIRNL